MKPKFLILLILFIGLTSTQSWSSTLSNVANSMPAGTWAQLNTTGFNTDYLRHPDGSNGHITLQYMGEGIWDPTTRRVMFLAAGHLNFSQLHFYTESSNTWTRGIEPPGAPISLGHGYNHNAISLTARQLGFVHVSSSIDFYEYDIANNKWTRGGSVTNDGGLALGFTYFPERSRWYAADGTFGKIREYDSISASWSTIATNEACFGGTGYYHQFASYNPVRKEIVFGGGNRSSGANVFSRNWCKMNSDGVITEMPLAPHTLRIPEDGNPEKGSLITIDPVTGDLLVLTQDGNFYAFNFSTNQWTMINDQSTRPAGLNHTSMNVTNGFVVPINTYGVIMYADFNRVNSTIWLYKHAQGDSVVNPPDIDSSSPSTPTGQTSSAVVVK